MRASDLPSPGILSIGQTLRHAVAHAISRAQINSHLIPDSPTARDLRYFFNSCGNACRTVLDMAHIDPGTGGGGGEVPVDPVGILPLFGFNLGQLADNPERDAALDPASAVIGTDYLAPTQAMIQPYVDAAKGLPFLVRLGFSHERIQKGNGATLDATYVGQLLDAMNLIQVNGGLVILQCHGYGRYWTKVAGDQALGAGYTYAEHNGQWVAHIPYLDTTNPPKVTAYDNMWNKVATAFKDHPALLGWGLMNEPFADAAGFFTKESYKTFIQSVIYTIQSVDSVRPMFVNGFAYATAKNWVAQSDDLKTLNTSSEGGIIFEAHQYPDDNGGKWANPNITIPLNWVDTNIAPFFNWCLANSVRGFIGEYGGPATATNFVAVTNDLLDLCAEHKVPFAQWRVSPGMSDTYANGMNLTDGSAKANATPLLMRIGTVASVVEEYGPIGV